MGSLRCAHCERVVPANPHIKNQTHCKREACRRDKKRLWQRQKMATDPDYKANQRECNKAWQERNPQYWQEYRKNHPQAAERNRIQQRERNRRRRKIAKMDTSEPPEVKPGTYFLVPEERREQVIAKMDASVRKITLILMPYEAAAP
jgi:hypothetical protein